MKELEKVIFDEIVRRTDMDVSTIGDFDENTPLFAKEDEEGPSMNLDSVDALELNMMLFDKWGIEADISEMPKLRTVKIIADYVRPYEEKKHG